MTHRADGNMKMYREIELIFVVVVLSGCIVSVNVQTVAPSSATTSRHHPDEDLKCSDLQSGQYYCEDPEIDPQTQQAANCDKDTSTVKVNCYPVKGIYCDGEEHTGESPAKNFKKEVACKWTNGHSFSVALLLSIFLGMFGVDRFYLGYPAIGLLKLCTLGFMFLGQLIDVLLIALQVVGPSDGSAYVIDYYGAGLTLVTKDNGTYVKPQYEL